MEHPLKIALDVARLSKEDLVQRVKNGRHRRRNGKRLHLSVNYINQLLRGDRHPHRVMAEAIAAALRLKNDAAEKVFAEKLVFWSPDEGASDAA